MFVCISMRSLPTQYTFILNAVTINSTPNNKVSSHFWHSSGKILTSGLCELYEIHSLKPTFFRELSICYMEDGIALNAPVNV